MKVYRIVSDPAYLWSGEGAKLFGGRWNSPGREMIYCATNLALCALEQLVHIRPAPFPTGYVCGQALLPESACEFGESTTDRLSDLDATRAYGDAWLQERRTVALVVSSVVLQAGTSSGDKNVLLNPRHPDFAKIELGSPQDFVWDSRLFS